MYSSIKIIKIEIINKSNAVLCKCDNKDGMCPPCADLNNKISFNRSS